MTKSEITKLLVDEIQSWPFAIACWEGGSVANQRADVYSDLDLVICVENGKISESFQKLESILKQSAQIEHQWTVPEPTWHGHGQRFYQLSETPQHFFLDIVIMEEKSTNRFLEKERHGTPQVFFDRKSFVKLDSADTADFRIRRKHRLNTIAESFPFYKTLVLKEVARKRPIDAMAFYRSLTNLLVELMGMKHRPYRYDFGLRYTHIDFPAAEQKELQEFLYPADLNQIEQNVARIENRSLTLITELRK